MTRLGALAVIAWLGATSEPAAPPAPAPGHPVNCLELPETRAYIEALRARMYSRWVAPALRPAGGRAQLTFELQRTGALARAEVTGPPDELNESALAALRAAAPFAPLDPPVDCLVGHRMRATFRAP